MNKLVVTIFSLLPALALPQSNGTTLSATTEVSAITCLDGGSATVVVDATLISTGAANAAEVTRSIDGATEAWIGQIRSQDFQSVGRTKEAYFTDSLTLQSGPHQLCYTFTQAGSQGNPGKQTTSCVDLTVACEASPACDRQGFFGDIVQSPAICGGNGNPNVPVHLKASAQGAVTLLIVGPNGFEMSVDMDRAGESCVYHYNWAAKGNNGGAGTYAFTAKDETGVLLATASAQWNCP